jgi:hypothetical protein
MTATTTMQSKGAAAKPCGCGGSGAAPAASCGCGCGGAGCASCQGQVYVRPQFFAGQLLTEDDLQSLEDYVVAKNRLHARYLFGAGVVCGLNVTCAPCAPGQVVVNPGYALDCCGNDIVVPCPQTLDVNAMVRALLQSQRGQDCGDPCAGSSASSSKSATPKPQAIARRYCLYVSYCEQSTDPVAPYASGDPCGQATCEPTRLQEGYQFELRCPESVNDCGAICANFWGCIGDPVAAERAIYESEVLGRYAARLAEAMDGSQEEQVQLGSDFWQALAIRQRELNELVRAERGLATEAAARQALEITVQLASLVARFWLQVTKLPQPEDLHGETLEAAERLLREMAEIIPRLVHERTLTTTLERAQAEALCEALQALHEESGRQRGLVLERRTFRFEPIKDLRIRYLAFGAVYARPMYVSGAESLQALQTWLIDHLERTSNTRCTLLHQVRAVTLPSPSTSGGSSGDARTLANAAEVLSCAVREVLKDCFCNALLPPCSTCDDQGVLLACLTVKDCAVTEICNLERQFVLTGPTLRYWIPELCRLGTAIEKWCCESRCEPRKPDERQIPSGDLAALVGSIFAGAPAAVKSAAAAILDGCPPPTAQPTVRSERSTGMLATLSALRTPAGGAESALDEVRAELLGTIATLREEIKALRNEPTVLRERAGKRSGKSDERELR